jgi:hypothetical protein
VGWLVQQSVGALVTGGDAFFALELAIYKYRSRLRIMPRQLANSAYGTI